MKEGDEGDGEKNPSAAAAAAAAVPQKEETKMISHHLNPAPPWWTH